MSVLQQLHHLATIGTIRFLDYQFARFIARHEPQYPDIIALSAAFLSWRNGLGDVCIPLERFADRPLFHAASLFAPPLEDWREALRQAPWVGDADDDYKPLVLEEDLLYLGKYRDYEARVAAGLLHRLQTDPDTNQACLQTGLRQLFANRDAYQTIAAALAVIKRFAIIIGGPGTGKTSTVLKVLVLLLEQQPQQRIALLAPTGKAAARLAESIQQQAQQIDCTPTIRELLPTEATTIHRLLRPDRQGRFRHQSDNPVHYDTIIVDEASMVDLPLLAHLLDALPDTSRVLLLGDQFQLASVEAGSVLADLCGNHALVRHSVKLTAQLEQLGITSEPPTENTPLIADSIAELRTSHRFGADSGIGQLAAAVKAKQPLTPAKLEQMIDHFADLDWIELTDEQLPESVLDWAVEHYREYLQATTVQQAYASFNQHRILCAVRQGAFGVEHVNQQILARLQQKRLLAAQQHAHGYPVLIQQNDYQQQLYNGDVGLLFQQNNGQVLACFPDHQGMIRQLSARQLPPHETAFAMTVHKSQGSEFDHVLLLLPWEASTVATQELIYTGLTRARRQVTIVAAKQRFLVACKRQTERFSGLARRLGWTG